MLRPIQVVFRLFLLALMAGCSSAPPPNITKEIMIPAGAAGTAVPKNELDSVRGGEQVKAYTIGRYIDPNNPEIMHEKNIIYRVEESSDWNLTPNEPFSIPFKKYQDNRRKLMDIQKPLTAELETEVKNQKQLRDQLKVNNELIRKTVEYNIKSAKDLEKVVKMTYSAGQKINELIAEIEKLKLENRKDQEFLDKLRQEQQDRGAGAFDSSRMNGPDAAAGRDSPATGVKPLRQTLPDKNERE